MLELQQIFELMSQAEGAEYVLLVVAPIGMSIAVIVFGIGRVFGARSEKERLRQKRIRDLDRLKQLGT